MNNESQIKILRAHAAELAPSLDVAVGSFYHGLDQDPSSHQVLSILSLGERQQLHRSQAAHLQLLIDPDANEAERQVAAERAGDMHAIIGVPASSLVTAFDLYLQKVSQIILTLTCSLVERSVLLHIVTHRLHADLRWQTVRMDAHQAQIDRVEQNLMTFSQSYRPWADIIRGVLEIFLEIPGITGTGFVRKDVQQKFVAEFVSGDYEYFWQAIQKQVLMEELSDPEWCFIKAARENNPVRVSNFSEHEYDSIRSAAAEAGVRSAIAIPIDECFEHASPVLCLTSPYPNVFNAAPLSRVIQGIIAQLNAVYRRADNAQRVMSGISFTERRFSRALLTRGGLLMFYQPIIDLISGAVVKVETLARLQLPNGKILSPGQFLPWFGQSELAELFSRGLTQALEQLAVWDRVGLDLQLNINLPPEILVHPECADWVIRALQHSGIEPSRLHLELLETKAPQDQEQRDHAIALLAKIGVRLDMDDLGSGYSSLQRLHLMPFSGIKVDQGIMRGCLEGSSKALGILYAITSLGRDLGLSVAIEGLENPGLMEVAVMFGAHQGQGYGIARPMPAADIAPWVKRWRWEINPLSPKTALGTWAKFWRWQRHLAPWVRSDALDVSACGISHFVFESRLHGSELDQAHQAMHQAIANADHDAARQQVCRIEDQLIALIT